MEGPEEKCWFTGGIIKSNRAKKYTIGSPATNIKRAGHAGSELVLLTVWGRLNTVLVRLDMHHFGPNHRIFTCQSCWN